MKKTTRDPQKFDAIRFFDVVARSRGSSLKEVLQNRSLIKDIVANVDLHRKNDVLMHGLRIESMFAYVAGALGHCSVVKQEDAGEAYFEDPKIAIPDYRIITKKGKEFFVEVKNCHKGISHKKSMPSFSLKADYFQKLMKYAEIFNRELKVAIYWSIIKRWSLIPVEALDNKRGVFTISLVAAMKRSEISWETVWLGPLPH